MWPGKNVLLWRWLLLFYIYILHFYRARYIFSSSSSSLSVSCALVRHGYTPHKCTWLAFFSSILNELANETPPTIIILRLMCAFFRIEFLHTRSLAHIHRHIYLIRTIHTAICFSPIFPFFVIFWVLQFFSRHRFFIVGGKRVIYSVNGTVFHISGWLRINMHTQNGEAFLPLKAASK